MLPQQWWGTSTCQHRTALCQLHHTCNTPALHCGPLVLLQGSGLSDGKWVTLGAHEVEDLGVVVRHLRSQGGVSSIGLWGRSMGAVTALLYSHSDPDIAGMVGLLLAVTRPWAGRRTLWLGGAGA